MVVVILLLAVLFAVHIIVFAVWALDEWGSSLSDYFSKGTVWIFFVPIIGIIVFLIQFVRNKVAEEMPNEEEDKP